MSASGDKRRALGPTIRDTSGGENALLRFLLKVLFVALFFQRLAGLLDVVLVRGFIGHEKLLQLRRHC